MGADVIVKVSSMISGKGDIMSEIQELEAKLVQSQKKLNDLQYEVNAIHGAPQVEG